MPSPFEILGLELAALGERLAGDLQEPAQVELEPEVGKPAARPASIKRAPPPVFARELVGFHFEQGLAHTWTHHRRIDEARRVLRHLHVSWRV
jgi:hypothetical protein